ncbi:sensor histidine kinase [Agromyces sp. NPDC058110]|uniref:sensor histidine kinase n=1 Tax=Agromyces sp. NPDC058110 TaxID=3346345 RepID=UPI0036DC6E25
MPAEPSRSVHSTWLYTLGSIVFFVGFFEVFVALTMLEPYSLAPDPLGATLIVLQLVAGATAIRYCWFLRVGLGGGLPSVWWTIALVAPAAAVWVLGLFVDGNAYVAASALWAAGSLLACLVPRPMRWLVLAASALLVIAHLLIATLTLGSANPFTTTGSGWAVTIYAVLLPLMLITSLWWWQIVVQLDRSRRIAGELAVTQERLRFASDLHDIQGHHLQVISLKSELAERLMAIDPDAAREHIHEVRLIAKQALEETRSLVAGYRQVALDDELENAREVLTAAGAACTLQLGALPADSAVRSALASVVREATTNILRHSEAINVSIALAVEGGRATLEIVNDGVTGAAQPDSGMGRGSGLAGLGERLAAVGGTFETSTDAAASRFVLTACAPAAAGVSA